MMVPRRKPTRAEVLAATGKTVPDVIAPGLRILFCGINPSLYSAAVGHHFARPGNRFWPALYAAGFTSRLLSPSEDHELLRSGYGITNIVARATARADELSLSELVEGGQQLEARVRQYAPHMVAFLGIDSYRKAFGRRHAEVGRQNERIGQSAIWLLPNPSGLNAHYRLEELAEVFGALRAAVGYVSVS